MTDVATTPARLAHDADWWKSAVIYQVYPRSFADSNGDGIGDLPGVLAHLDYLHTLGVDAIWLSPIYASPQDDNGYDISDYRAIDPAFGTLDDVDELIAQAHARGIKIVMDLVVNHTSDEHAWFRESAGGRESARRDWYIWRPPRPGFEGGTPGAEPNNWSSFFSGSAWQWDAASGEYYLHLFSRKQPDLNWENPEVRTAIFEMMTWWLDRGVDGFRMDVINLISKVPGLPDGVVAPGAVYGDGTPFCINGPRLHEFLQEMHARVFAGRVGQLVTVGEMPGVTVEDARLFTDPARNELNMVFQFEHVDLDHGAHKFDPLPLDLRALKGSLGRWQEGLHETGWNSLYWNNHDQPRAVSRFGDDGAYWSQSARALGAVLHLMRGTPYIYQGEELGMTNVPFASIDEVRDIESLNFFADAVGNRGESAEVVLAGIRHSGRDNARTPMQWSAAPHGGFTTGQPWIEANPNADRINAESQVGRAGSVFEFYRALVRMRHDDPVVGYGDIRMLALEHPALVAYSRALGDARLLVVANFGVEPIDPAGVDELDPSWARATLVLSNYPAAEFGEPLRPWEVRVFREPGLAVISS